MASYNGIAYGYAWNVSAGTTCSIGSAIGQTVYWCEVMPDWANAGFGPMIMDQGVFYNYQSGMAC